MSSIPFIVVVTAAIFSEVSCSEHFQSSHWPNGSTQFLTKLENSQVRGVYVPFRHGSPLFNISMQNIKPATIDNNNSNVNYMEVASFATTTTTTASTPTRIQIPIPTESADRYEKCEDILKSYVNENEGLKFEVRTYAMQYAKKTNENREMKETILAIEKRNIELFMNFGGCKDQIKLITKQLNYCRG